MTSPSSYAPLALAAGEGWTLDFDLRFAPEPYVLHIGGRVWRFRTRRGAEVVLAAWGRVVMKEGA